MINKVLLMEFFKDDDIKVVDKDFYIKSQMKSDVIKYITILEEENEIKTTKLNAIRKYLLNNKLYTFKYDDEELFEITTDKKAKDDLLNILNGGDEE